MWQYGDSDLGGWVYDSTLSVTCPSDPCSVLNCGFRANCVQEPSPRCVCREGFEGDPAVRCYPKNVPASCPCLNVKLSSSGSKLTTFSVLFVTYRGALLLQSTFRQYNKLVYRIFFKFHLCKKIEKHNFIQFLFKNTWLFT